MVTLVKVLFFMTFAAFMQNKKMEARFEEVELRQLEIEKLHMEAALEEQDAIDLDQETIEELPEGGE